MPDYTLNADPKVPSTAWAAAALVALAREEAAGRKPERLLEDRRATWERFKGRMTSDDLIALLFEDAAVVHSVPFDAAVVGVPTDSGPVATELATSWLETLGTLDLEGGRADYISAQARLLGVPTRLGRSELHVIKPHQRVLELPGTGGQLAHHLVVSQSDLTLQDNFTILCGSWQEVALAGVVALDAGAPNVSFVERTEAVALKDPAHPARRKSFDFVIGLDPEKGGLFKEQDQLAVWFAHAKIVLV